MFINNKPVGAAFRALSHWSAAKMRFLPGLWCSFERMWLKNCPKNSDEFLLHFCFFFIFFYRFQWKGAFLMLFFFFCSPNMPRCCKQDFFCPPHRKRTAAVWTHSLIFLKGSIFLSFSMCFFKAFEKRLSVKGPLVAHWSITLWTWWSEVWLPKHVASCNPINLLWSLTLQCVGSISY